MRSKEYAQAFGEVLGDKEMKHGSEYAQNLLRVIRYRGHQRLLPSIVTELETKVKEQGEVGVLTLTVARSEDEAVFQGAIEKDQKDFGFDDVEVQTVVDDSVIGGYRIESREHLIDRTYKKALLEMYQKMTS